MVYFCSDPDQNNKARHAAYPAAAPLQPRKKGRNICTGGTFSFFRFRRIYYDSSGNIRLLKKC